MFYCLMLLAIAGVPLLIAEIVVRALFRYNTPDTVRQNSLQYVPTIFARHRLMSSQEIRVDEAWGLKSETKRTSRVYRINDLGYRGAPFLADKPAGIRRVVALGGSSVFDPSAGEGADWPHLLVDKLGGLGVEGVEVINAGIPGHASFDSLGRLYSQIWTFRPDYVLIYGAWNDIKYFDRLSLSRPLLWQVMPYDDRADPFQNYLGMTDWVLCRSQLYVKLRNRYLMRRLQPGIEGAARQGGARNEYEAVGPKQYRLNLELLVDASREIGAIPILLTEASLLSRSTSKKDRERVHYEYQGLTHDALVRAIEECNEIAREIAARKSVKFLDTAAILGHEGKFFDDHVHLSRAGAEGLATAVSGFLSLLLEEDPPSGEVGRVGQESRARTSPPRDPMLAESMPGVDPTRSSGIGKRP